MGGYGCFCEGALLFGVGTGFYTNFYFGISFFWGCCWTLGVVATLLGVSIFLPFQSTSSSSSSTSGRIYVAFDRGVGLGVGGLLSLGGGPIFFPLFISSSFLVYFWRYWVVNTFSIECWFIFTCSFLLNSLFYSFFIFYLSTARTSGTSDKASTSEICVFDDCFSLGGFLDPWLFILSFLVLGISFWDVPLFFVFMLVVGLGGKSCFYSFFILFCDSFLVIWGCSCFFSSSLTLYFSSEAKEAKIF